MTIFDVLSLYVLPAVGALVLPFVLWRERAVARSCRSALWQTRVYWPARLSGIAWAKWCAGALLILALASVILVALRAVSEHAMAPASWRTLLYSGLFVVWAWCLRGPRRLAVFDDSIVWGTLRLPWSKVLGVEPRIDEPHRPAVIQTHWIRYELALSAEQRAELASVLTQVAPHFGAAAPAATAC